MSFLTSTIAKNTIPKFIRKRLLASVQKSAVLAYYSTLSEPPSAEIQQVLDYLKKRPITVFPYDSLDKYVASDIEVFTDHDKRMHYVFLEGKRLYFKKGWSKNRIRKAFNGLKMEQDPACPHCYVKDDFQVETGEVLADIGAAEGNFALLNVEICSRILLFESDPRWIEALKATFEPWKEKVTIVNKFVGDISNETCTILDDYLQPKDKISFLKVDIEGAESMLLRGAVRVLQDQKPLKIAICTYHKPGDDAEFTKVLIANGFKTSVGDGFMLLYHEKNFLPPYLRKGIVRAVKK